MTAVTHLVQFEQSLSPEDLATLADMVAARLEARLDVAMAEALTIAETCKLLKTSDKTLTELERDGILVPFRHGRLVRYDRRKVAALLAGELTADDSERAA